MKHETAIPIGSGGMGEVFKAWDPDLERHIALKYLKHDDPVFVERLLREARAQARVDHPSVCKVYEVGEDEGRPFIAMEYVDGEPLDHAARDLSLEQKVVLVREIAEAVQAAHTAGLIHRDLKPANILVVDRDGAPQPYVLDFGIARLEEVAGLTMTGQVMGTPGYLSPEQARGDLKAVDRRTDVFSLGVILYELLGGRRPFAGDSNVETLVRLLEDEPEPLRQHAPEIPRDLETIVMTCLEKDPERRYPSARALADDLGRFLDGEPVAARPIGFAERLARRMRKNPVATAAIAIAAVALFTLVTVAVGGWIKYTADLKAERNLALEAQAEAERNAQEANEVTEFLVGVFQGSDPEVARGGTQTARELLDAGAERIRTSFEEQPEVQTRLLRTLGTIYRKLALFAPADELLNDAVVIGEGLGDEHRPHLASSLDQLAIVYAIQGRFDESEPLFRRALTIREELYGPDSEKLLPSLDRLGNLTAMSGRLDEAETLYRRALTVRERQGDPDREIVAYSLANLSLVLHRQGRFEEAEAGFRRALAINERVLEADDPRISHTLINLGTLLDATDREVEAEALFRRALAVNEEVYGADHPRTALVLTNISSALRGQERYGEAETLIRRALAIREKAYGRNHSTVGQGLEILGNIYRMTGRLQEAESALLECLAIFEDSLGPDHANIAYACNHLGQLRLEQQRFDEAVGFFERSLSVGDLRFAPDHPQVLTAREGLAAAYRGLGREEDAAAIEAGVDAGTTGDHSD